MWVARAPGVFRQAEKDCRVKEKKPPVTVNEILTPEEIQSLRQSAKEAGGCASAPPI